MKIEYKFAEIYATYKGREAKNAIRHLICQRCNYNQATFWRRIRGKFKDISSRELHVWSEVTGKSIDCFVSFEANVSDVREAVK